MLFRSLLIFNNMSLVQEGKHFNLLLKFVIIGESGVGKSCIVLNFTEQKPRRQHQVTIACEFAARIVDVKSQKIKVQIWDTAGQENFRSITRSYYRTAVAAIVVYDVTQRKSFEKVQSWLKELKENSQENICIAVVGNKIDLEKQREVSYQEGYDFVKGLKHRFTETCAFDLETIEPLFRGLTEDVLSKIDRGILDPHNEQMGIKPGDLFVGKKSKKTSQSLGGGDSNSEGKKGCC